MAARREPAGRAAVRRAMNQRYYASPTDRTVGRVRHLLELNANTNFWSAAAALAAKPAIFRPLQRHDYCTIPRNLLEGEGMRSLARCLVGVCLALLPAIASAQTSSIAGTVRDTSGAVLPGVTVEVSSPVLIEKTRSAVTDGSGQYKIIELRPGTYSVTFTLPGFS